jgi:hypothetical protein
MFYRRSGVAAVVTGNRVDKARKRFIHSRNAGNMRPQWWWSAAMPESNDYRVKADEFSRLATAADTEDQRDRFLRMEQSYRLLARNADWISATGDFIKDMRARALRAATQHRRNSGSHFIVRDWRR